MESAEKFNSLIVRHNLQFYDFDPKDLGWMVSKSKIAGKGTMATKRFNPGDVIFTDYPLVVGPRSVANVQPMCVACYDTTGNLKPCSRGCLLPVCSSSCENSSVHQFECLYLTKMSRHDGDESNWSIDLLRSITPVRCLNLSPLMKEIVDHLHQVNGPQQGFEVQLVKKVTKSDISVDEENFMRLCCRALDANAYEIPLLKNADKGTSLRGLFSMASMMNHSCCPNTTHAFDDNYQMIIRASNEISPGQEITSAYSPLLLGTPARRAFLAQSKHFYCRCFRCKDPTELGTFLSALKCRDKACYGVLVSATPLDFRADWKCTSCELTLSAEKVAVIQKVIAQTLSAVADLKHPDSIMNYIKRNQLVADSNHTIVQFKYVLLRLLGYAEGYEWPRMSNSLVNFKKTICIEILSIVETLKLGHCEIKDVCQSELRKTNDEIMRRESDHQQMSI